MAQPTQIAPLDLTPTGHLPAAVSSEQAPAPCPVFRDCNDPKPGHYDHSGHGALKVLDERECSTVLDAGMVALTRDDGPPRATVYIGVGEFSDLASVLAKTAELRRFLDEVDELAMRTFNDHRARG